MHTSRIQVRNVTTLGSLLSENNIIILNCFQKAGQEIPSPLWVPKFRYRVHKNLPLKRVLCQINPLRFLRHCLFSPRGNGPWWGRASSLSRLHNHTHQTHHTWYDSSGRVISPSQRPLPENKQHSQDTGIDAPGGIRTRNPSKQAAADPSLRLRGHFKPSTFKLNFYITLSSTIRFLTPSVLLNELHISHFSDVRYICVRFILLRFKTLIIRREENTV